jgi:hypothetical protein
MSLHPARAQPNRFFRCGDLPFGCSYVANRGLARVPKQLIVCERPKTVEQHGRHLIRSQKGVRNVKVSGTFFLLQCARVGMEMLAAGGRELIQEPGDLGVWDERQDNHVLRQAGRIIVVVGNGAAVGSFLLEPLENVLKPMDDIDQSGEAHASLSQRAM